MIYGVGEQITSSMADGRTGINVCCQANGYNNDDRAWIVDDKILKYKIKSILISKVHYARGPMVL